MSRYLEWGQERAVSMSGEDIGLKTETSQYLDVPLPHGFLLCTEGVGSRLVKNVSTCL
jgi:hypothetical protein